jgi:hypothetical protein
MQPNMPQQPGPVMVSRREGTTELVGLSYAGYHRDHHVWLADTELRPGDDLVVGELPPNTEIAVHYSGAAGTSIGVDAWDRVRARAWLDPPPPV